MLRITVDVLVKLGTLWLLACTCYALGELIYPGQSDVLHYESAMTSTPCDSCRALERSVGLKHAMGGCFGTNHAASIIASPRVNGQPSSLEAMVKDFEERAPRLPWVRPL